MRTDIQTVLTGTGLPVTYSHFKEPQAPPFLTYLGDGQDQFAADNTRYAYAPAYTVEYYYTRKSEETEETIEAALLAGGWHFEKDADTWIESEAVFQIVYYVRA